MLEPTIQAMSVCAPAEFTVFFEWDQAAITGQAGALIHQMLNNGGACRIYSIRVAGHSDTKGDQAYREIVSRARADAVKAYMLSLGVPETLIHANGWGSRQMAKATSDGVREPLNRRTTVVIIYY